MLGVGICNAFEIVCSYHESNGIAQRFEQKVIRCRRGPFNEYVTIAATYSESQVLHLVIKDLRNSFL